MPGNARGVVVDMSSPAHPVEEGPHGLGVVVYGHRALPTGQHGCPPIVDIVAVDVFGILLIGESLEEVFKCADVFVHGPAAVHQFGEPIELVIECDKGRTGCYFFCPECNWRSLSSNCLLMDSWSGPEVVLSAVVQCESRESSREIFSCGVAKSYTLINSL